MIGRPLLSAQRINGWLVLATPEFENRFVALATEVERLKANLPDAEYRRHPTAKQFAAVYRLMREIVPSDPNAPAFRLSDDLSAFRRAKSHGLPESYRLFWVFSERHRTIIFLYLNDRTTLRKEGAGTDVYAQFKRLVARGKIGDDFDANYRIWHAAHPEPETEPEGRTVGQTTTAQSGQAKPRRRRESRERGRKSGGET